jgi:membrane-associated protease RseP (regulator of RpoE activity)
MSMNPQTDASVITCANCNSPMPRELRFCRSCGFRLGEGPAEYTETVRFKNAPPGTIPGNSSAPFNPYGAAAGPMAAYPAGPLKKRKRRMSGMTWIFLGLLIFFVAAAGFTAIVKPIRQNIRTEFTTPVSTRSWVGVNEFDTTDGGVTFEYVDAPDSPADKAGLVGGDVITTFDGQTVTHDDQMMDLLERTPIGKTVDVVFVRDGETKKTTLTTISEQEFERLQELFKNRPEGRAWFGYDDGDAERVPIEGTKMFGVRLGEINPNRPADIAGVKEGDIVIEFDGVPIRTPEEMLSRVRRAIPYSIIKLIVIRNGERMEIPVKMGKA